MLIECISVGMFFMRLRKCMCELMLSVCVFFGYGLLGR